VTVILTPAAARIGTLLRAVIAGWTIDDRRQRRNARRVLLSPAGTARSGRPTTRAR
jgi:hypothetical protein